MIFDPGRSSHLTSFHVSYSQLIRKMPSRSASPTSFRKPCTLCSKPQPVLVRCKIDSTGTWHLVCPGKCWKSVSGGTIDAAGHKDEFPHYIYGGMWKNKHELVSAKKPKRKANDASTMEDKGDEHSAEHNEQID